MKLDDGTFNRIVTLILLIYFIAMYTISYFTGRPLELANLLAFLAPALNNSIYIAANTLVQNAKIKANGVSTIPPTVITPTVVTPTVVAPTISGGLKP